MGAGNALGSGSSSGSAGLARYSFTTLRGTISSCFIVLEVEHGRRLEPFSRRRTHGTTARQRAQSQAFEGSVPLQMRSGASV